MAIKKAAARKMSRSIGADVIEGMRNAIAYAKGDRTRSVTHHVVIPGDLDVRG